MVDLAPSFPQKIKAAPPELFEILVGFQSSVKNVVVRLDDEMKGVVRKLADNKNQ